VGGEKRLKYVSERLVSGRRGKKKGAKKKSGGGGGGVGEVDGNPQNRL